MDSCDRDAAPQHTTAIGWQGIRFLLPADWSLTGLSMDRDTGYLRVDSPGSGLMTVQVRWANAARPETGSPSLFSLLAPKVQKLFGRSTQPVGTPDLRANLEKFFKDTAKQARKARVSFESNLKPEKVEGAEDERRAINFSWVGAGRGQGKIWHCKKCNRVIIAQVVGTTKEQHAMASVASQLFATIEDHSDNGFDLWALYDLEVGIPEDFLLETQQLYSGHLRLTFRRGGEKIALDRWGLADVALKKFTASEWLAGNALAPLSKMTRDRFETPSGHEVERFRGPLGVQVWMRAMRDAHGSMRRFPSRYEGGIWTCEETNKLFAVQIYHNRRTEGLWESVVERCACH